MKIERLEKIQKECIEKSSEPTVFGEGNYDAEIVLVGEAPGAKEVEIGRPFVGQAGKNLDEFLKILDMKREDIYITNVVKIRPYKISEKTGKKSNRPPNKEEVDVYEKYLFEELDVIKPKIVVTLGNVPLKSILKDKKATIGEKHGVAIKDKEYYVFPLYHPASIIYRRELKEVYEEDLVKLKKFKNRI